MPLRKSYISEIELLTAEEEATLKLVLSYFQQHNLTTYIKEETIILRKTTGLKLPDSIIVATAIVNNAILVTSDQKLLKLPHVKSVEYQHLL